MMLLELVLVRFCSMVLMVCEFEMLNVGYVKLLVFVWLSMLVY